MSQATVGAVVVCYRPPPGLSERLSRVSGQIARLVVVDNGPPAEHAALAASLAALRDVEIIANETNRGIATALNQGMTALAAAGVRYALLLDHDSLVIDDMVARLLAALRAWPGRAAVAVPRILYDLPDIQCRWPVTYPGARLRFRRIPATEMAGPVAVDLAISSGMLVDLQAVAAIGGFRDGMFIDLVDTEFCLRARGAGFDVIAVPDAQLRHSLGNVERRRLAGVKVYPTHHAPLRHYYLARNRVHLWKLYGSRFPSWAWFELMSGAKLLIKSLCFEHDRWEKLAATARGTWEGLRTRPPPV